MLNADITDIPEIHLEILNKCEEIGFTMPSDVFVGSLLKTLISSKPKGRFLELGTGIGLSLSWMVDGMDEEATLVTVDNDPELIKIAGNYFGKDPRIEIICDDGAAWIERNKTEKFELIFADAWPGKYEKIGEILEMVEIGGFYVLDDMSYQANWPPGHQVHVDRLTAYLDNRKDFIITKLNWSTGLIIAVKKDINNN
ncbi:MAG TPA: class I SAM-dependent methyltransferase [Eudoraea sp.]|nr:class I SAM-dependent methyltransferase [Eudoraea sp.]